MKRFLNIFVNVLILALLASCAKDIVDVNGDIKGVVKDSDDGHLLQNCNITLSPSGKTYITNADGQFNFEELEPGTYTLSFTKTGYNDATKTVTVVSGQSTDASVIMKSKGAFAISSNSLDFGDLNSSMTFQLVNNSDVSTSFKVSDTPSWLTLSMSSGVVQQGGSLSVVANVNRDAVDYGEHAHTLTISYTGRTNGNVTLNVKMTKVKQTEPKVSIDQSATEITQNSFKIKGAIVATGGSAITSYGFCWSVAHNPTIADSKVDNGSTVETCEFNSLISNLAIATSYYVRAYATNSLGTSYSNEIVVTTQDVASDKWDGNIAKSFAGGSGSVGDPYKVATGGQLLLMKDYKDKCFVLANNIDLDNHNWLPFVFNGKLDGAGYVISNLKIERTDDYQGLFSKMQRIGTVKNLTIKGVNINAPQNNFIGALVGQCSGSVSNVHVILTPGSKLMGNESVGGLIGKLLSPNTDGCSMSDCTVKALSDDVIISGGNGVGGICGGASHGYSFGSADIDNCISEVTVAGNRFVGGIVGSSYSRVVVTNCGATANIKGTDYIGGIIGEVTGAVQGCKAVVTAEGDEYVGGISGSAGYTGSIVACYSTGKLSGSYGVAGISPGGSVELCYSTAESKSKDFVGIGGRAKDCATTSATASGTNTVANCTDITSHLRDAYSSHAEYWDFSKTWLWEGKINGQSVKVSCPRLSWE